MQYKQSGCGLGLVFHTQGSPIYEQVFPVSNSILEKNGLGSLSHSGIQLRICFNMYLIVHFF